MRKAVVIGLVLMLMLAAGGTAASGSPTFTLKFVSATRADPPDQLLNIADFTVQLPKRKQDNIFYLVQLVTHCLDTNATRLGGLAWVGTNGQAVSISGSYEGAEGATCEAWVYNTAGKHPDPSKPASNVAPFPG